MHPTLILQPAIPFLEIDQALTQLEWKRAVDTSVAPPVIPGEPEFASFSCADGVSISYTFNPVVRLRILVFYGEDASEVSTEVKRELPTLGVPELRELLQSNGARELLLGILAAREVRAFKTLDLIEQLRDHSESVVARAAQKAHEEMLKDAIGAGLEWVREEKERHPDRSVIFPYLGDAEMRRQTLRWLIHDYRETNVNINGVLRSGLADEDWEVRATAMLAAVRLKATELRDDIRRLDFATSDRTGPDESSHTILLSAQKIAIEYLAQEIPAGTLHDDFLYHLRRCMLNLPVTEHDETFRFINALTEPLDVEGSALTEP